jgi:hypothetical protein
VSFPTATSAKDAARTPKRGYQPLHPEPVAKLHHPPKRRDSREIHHGGDPSRPLGRPGEGAPKPGAKAKAMAKDFPTEGGAFGAPGQTAAFPTGAAAFTPKVVPMVPASQSNPATPWLRPVSTPAQGLGPQ